MKTAKVIMKVLAALAAIAGTVYVVATYGEKIVAWAKNLLGRCKCETCDCPCEDDCDDCQCEGDCDNCCCEQEAPAEEAAAEEAPAEEAAEEAPAEEDTVQAEETDFEA